MTNCASSTPRACRDIHMGTCGCEGASPERGNSNCEDSRLQIRSYFDITGACVKYSPGSPKPQSRLLLTHLHLPHQVAKTPHSVGGHARIHNSRRQHKKQYTEQELQL